VSYVTIDALRSHLGQSPVREAYAAKQLHPLPQAETVKRDSFVLDLVRGKRVLEFGASGPLHRAVRSAAASYLGVDKAGSDGVVAFDLDDVSQSALPAFDAEIILCGELLEHLSNPGWFLARLKRQYPAIPLLVTVPNAFSAIARTWLARGVENVNQDHVAWYSPHTLRVLLQRAGYTQADLAYYNGDGPTAEGLVVLTE
jgi:hypothetical protein